MTGFDVDLVLDRGGRTIAARFAGGAGVTALCGPSGIGKSSVLAAIAGLLRPRAGHVRVDGEALFDHAAGIDVPAERRACGMVFQDLRLFPHLGVERNLRYGEQRVPPERRIVGFEEAVDFLDIGPLLRRRVTTLSGGEAQRVAIGRALLSGPRFLLLDEPLAALDTRLRDGISRVIERLRDDFALPMILVSHSAQDIARLADRVVSFDEMPVGTERE